MEGSNWELRENQTSSTIKKAIQNIRKGTKILICKADKGNCTIIMNKLLRNSELDARSYNSE